jgi:hypothetical protein
MAERGEQGIGLVVGGMGGATLASLIAILLADKPAESATPDEKVHYLIEALTTLIPVLAEVVEGQTQLVGAVQQWLAAQGVIPPVVEVIVKTPWVAKEPEEIFNQVIRTAGVFFSDKMINFTNGKRLIIKVESTLDQACDIQVLGNIADTRELAVDIYPVALPCAANSNISAVLAWDNWHPFIGVSITTVLAPTVGILNVTAVIQE